MAPYERVVQDAVLPARGADARRSPSGRGRLTELRATTGLLFLGSASALAYASLTPHGPHRPALMTSIALSMVISAAVNRLAGPAFAERARRGVGGLLTVLVTAGFVTIWVALDGGISSPINAAFLLPLALSIASAPRAALPVTGIFLIGLVAGAALGGPLVTGPLVIWGAQFALTATAVAWVANARMRHQRELRKVLDRLEALAAEDPLTGVLNRRGLSAFLDTVAAQPAEAGPVALLVVDLDHFKNINDVHGHAKGDEVLVAAAQAIGASVRRQDVVARTGGEEFAVLLVDTEPERALTVAERIRTAIAACSPTMPVTASVGVAVADSGLVEVDALHLAADRAMYEAKELGRDRVVLRGSATAMPTPTSTRPPHSKSATATDSRGRESVASASRAPERQRVRHRD